MDYLEGALLGRIWSDTDYENRRHTGAWLWFSFAFWLVSAVLVWRINRQGQLPWARPASFWAILTLVLIVVGPFLSAIYYRLPVLGRLPILGLHMLKYLAALFVPWTLFVPLLRVPKDDLFGETLQFLDETAGTFIERNTELNEVFGLIFSGLALILLGILAVLGLLLLMTLLPILYLKLVTALQAIADRLYAGAVQLYRILRRAIERRLTSRHAAHDEAEQEGLYGT